MKVRGVGRASLGLDSLLSKDRHVIGVHAVELFRAVSLNSHRKAHSPLQ